MNKYTIFWSLSDSGKEVINADTEKEAREIFYNMDLTELLGHNSNIADVGRINEEAGQ